MRLKNIGFITKKTKNNWNMERELKKKGIESLPEEIADLLYSVKLKGWDGTKEEFLNEYDRILVDDTVYLREGDLYASLLRPEDYFLGKDGKYSARMMHCMECVINNGQIIKNRYGGFGLANNEVIHSRKVDNFDLLSKILSFKEDLPEEIANDRFYMLQIMTRSKDTGEKPRIIRTMFVESRAYLMSHKDMIVKLCETFNARAYLHVNHSSYKTCSLKAFGELAKMVENEHYKGILSLPETLAGEYCAAGEDKRWIVDLDGKKTATEIQPYIDFITAEYFNEKKKRNWKIDVVPTVSGSHLLVSPFFTGRFEQEFPGINIHRHNPTVLYYGG